MARFSRLRSGNKPRRLLHGIHPVPTLVTLGNLLCGCLAIVRVGEGGPDNYVQAAQLILLAMVFDSLDGMMARLARVAGNFGAQLDSLSDLVTFGVAPAYVVMSVGRQGAPLVSGELLLILAGFYVSCTAIRLARFNVETTPDASSHQSFFGLPSPAAAGVIATSILVWGRYRADDPDAYTIAFQRILPFLMLALGLLMISRIRYEHMVSRFLRRTQPFVRLLEVLLMVVCLALVEDRWVAIWVGFTYYAIRGPFQFAKNRLLHPEPETTALPDPEEELF